MFSVAMSATDFDRVRPKNRPDPDPDFAVLWAVLAGNDAWDCDNVGTNAQKGGVLCRGFSALVRRARAVASQSSWRGLWPGHVS